MKLESTGEIIAREHRAFNGSLERIEWEWQGGDLAYFSERWIYREAAQINNGVITLGPLRLRIVAQDWPGYIVAKDGLKARLLYRLYRCVWYTEIIYARLILTAAVWRLAKHTPGVVPTWRDVYVLDRIARWLGK